MISTANGIICPSSKHPCSLTNPKGQHPACLLREATLISSAQPLLGTKMALTLLLLTHHISTDFREAEAENLSGVSHPYDPALLHSTPCNFFFWKISVLEWWFLKIEQNSDEGMAGCRLGFLHDCVRISAEDIKIWFRALWGHWKPKTTRKKPERRSGL